MLGVRRESVTEDAGQLQAAGLIRYARGHIAVLDRAGLERRSCDCHAVVKKEYDRQDHGQAGPSAAVAGLAGRRPRPPHAAARGRSDMRNLIGDSAARRACRTAVRRQRVGAVMRSHQALRRVLDGQRPNGRPMRPDAAEDGGERHVSRVAPRAEAYEAHRNGGA